MRSARPRSSTSPRRSAARAKPDASARALFLDVETAFARARAETAVGEGDTREAERWLRAFEAASKARSELVRRNLNPQLVVEGLLLDLRASVSA